MTNTTSYMNRLAWAALALLGAGGCAQWKEHIAEPSPLERNFSHPMLAGRADYYPRLVPAKDTTPTVGTVATDTGRRPLVVTPGAATTDSKAQRVAVAPRRAPAPRTPGFTAPTARAGGDSLELESTSSGLSFAGPATEPTTAGLDLEAVPERPRAPKATADVGLGDPAASHDWTTEGGALEAAAGNGLAPAPRALTVEAGAADAPARNPRKAEGPDADQARLAVSFDPAEERPAGQVAERPEAEATASSHNDEVPAPSGATGARMGDGTAAAEALAAAQRLLGVRTPWDEGRFLAHLMAAADLDVRASDSTEVVKAVHDHLEAEGLVFGTSNSPEPGDLIFFSNTFDRDDDGRADDWFTMVGIVEAVDGGTITFIGVTQGEVRRMVLDLDRPSAERASDGALLNSQLRAKALSDRPFTKYLAGELVMDFGRLPDELSPH